MHKQLLIKKVLSILYKLIRAVTFIKILINIQKKDNRSDIIILHSDVKGEYFLEEWQNIQ